MTDYMPKYLLFLCEVAYVNFNMGYQMARRRSSSDIVVLLVVGALVAQAMGWVDFTQWIPQTQSVVGGAGGAGISDPGRAATAYMSFKEFYTGAKPTGDLNVEIYSSANDQWLTETEIDANPDTFGTLPTSLVGYAMVGNDNYASGTDRGVEV